MVVPRVSVQRVLASSAAAVALLLGPQPATAGNDAQQPAKRDPAVDRAAARAIVHLDTRSGRITVFAGELGRYFSIVGTDGQVVAERISADELAASHP